MSSHKLQRFIADLHIHTCLSPCAENDMTPPNIAQQAKKNRIDILGVCDHNAAENCASVAEAARDCDITVFPGMEITSSEEVHILGLFNTFSEVLVMQEIIKKHLDGSNDEDTFGMQLVVDKKGNYTGKNDNLLIGATNLPVNAVVQKIHANNGIAIAAHIDRQSFSIISQLGFIPEDLRFDALEISSRMAGLHHKDIVMKYPDYHNYSFLCSSDAHLLNDIGRGTTKLVMAKPTLEEFRKALNRKDGREIILQ